MFSVEFLNRIRASELAFYRPYLPPGSRVLEIGGGTGVQAKMLTELGLDVVSVDLPGSTYAEDRVFPIVDYDGKHFPFEPGSFDIVFSSNVLEHIHDLDELHGEIRRVLKPGGYSVHAMPSGTWRWWTNVSHYVDLLQRIWRLLPGLLPRGFTRSEAGRLRGKLNEILGTIRYFAIPPRHGEFGNCLTEIRTFSSSAWRKHFERNGYRHIDIHPMGLFYTGYMILGPRLALETRARLSRLLGSACVLYRVQD